MAAPNFKNRTLYHLDNLDVLRGMNSESVHLIATDPPFNKSRDFHATPDSIASGARFQDRWSWRKDIHDEWLIEIQRDHPEVWSVITTAKQVYGDDMGAFLCWLGVRLLEMRRVLREDGSIYLHIDHTAHAYVKTLMDAIFGKQNFRDAIIWHRSAENLSRKKLRRAAEIILYYTKGKTFRWHPLFEALDEEQVNRDYRYEDEHGRYTTTSCTNNAIRPNMVYEFNGNVRQWRYSQETMQKYAMEGRLVYNKDGIPRRKRYLSEVDGKLMTNVWSDIKVIASNAKERTGYPTQKPLALYERIIKASSNPGDIVLDPFCGCATTPIAAERLGRQWVGIDIWEKAHEAVLNRLEAEGLAVPENRGGVRMFCPTTQGLLHLGMCATPRRRLNEPTVESLLSWYCRHRQVGLDATHRPANSAIGCCWTWARIVRDAVVITALTLACWRLTMLAQRLTEEQTHTAI